MQSKSFLFAAAAAVILIAPHAARAQDTAPAAEKPAVAAEAPVAAPAGQARENKEATEEIVVTAVSKGRAATKSSVSVTTLTPAAIEDLAPRTTAEVFRSIPGFRSESSGGEGNANIAVRGIPISTGGAKFLQLQEDGLPILEFGDIAFGNADIFSRMDYTVARLQAVRGGSASTFASNSPGGVINFITETGQREGGAIGFTRGATFDDSRTDFVVGGPVAEGWYGSVGGFYRRGEGTRAAGYTAEDGGQVRASLTRKFETGFLRLGVKYLNDHAIAYMPAPVKVTGTESNPKWGPLPGFDASSQALQSALYRRNFGLGGSNEPRASDVADGMHPDVLAFSGRASFELPHGFMVDNNFRYARNRGHFIAPFTAGTDTVSSVAADVGGAGATARYANGPHAGELVPTGANGNGLLAKVVLFDTELNSLNNFANDLALSRDFDVGGKLTAKLGYYRAGQKIAMDWLWSSHLLEVKGDNAALVDVVDSAGTAVTQGGQVGYGATFFGNCCRRSFDVEYDIDAPYASLSYTSGPLIVDAGARVDIGRAGGTYADGKLETRDMNGDGIIQKPETLVTAIDFANAKPVDYGWHYLSYSVGANYSITETSSAFARASRGGRANADRLLFGPGMKANGKVSSADAAVDMVDQYEAGARWRKGSLALFGTLFWAKTEETNYEATSQKFTNAEYDSKGLELEGNYAIQGLDLAAGVTYTHARITRDSINPANVGHKPRRQADFIYQATGSYRFGSARVGTSLVGTTASYAGFDNKLVMPGYVVVNPFASVELSENLSLSVALNNAFNTFAATEVEESSLPANGIVRGRPLNGRSGTATLRYAF